MGAERRQHERFELLAQVELSSGDRVGTMTTINISAGGVFLRNDGNVAFEVGDEIRVRFEVPDLVAFTIGARIIRVVAQTAKAAALAAMWTSSDAVATNALGQLLWSLKRT